MTVEAIRKPESVVEAEPQRAPDVFSREVAIARASTQMLLEVVQTLDAEALDARTVSGMGTRRHVLARLVAHSATSLALLDDRAPSTGHEGMLALPLDAFVASLVVSLEAVLVALETAASTSPTSAALVACSAQRSWLELTRVDLDAAGVWAPGAPSLRGLDGESMASPFA